MYIYLYVSICVYICIITYEMTYTFQLLATLLTKNTYRYFLCRYEYTSLYIHINYARAYVHLFSYFYTSYTSESLKWPAFSIRTILFVDPSPPSIIVISDLF